MRGGRKSIKSYKKVAQITGKKFVQLFFKKCLTKIRGVWYNGFCAPTRALAR